MAVQSADETIALRSAVAKATVTAVMAGMRAIRPGVVATERRSGRRKHMLERGRTWHLFRPWAMVGDNAVFPRPSHFARADTIT